jgi:hypothetical protein
MTIQDGTYLVSPINSLFRHPHKREQLAVRASPSWPPMSAIQWFAVRQKSFLVLATRVPSPFVSLGQSSANQPNYDPQTTTRAARLAAHLVTSQLTNSVIDLC